MDPHVFYGKNDKIHQFYRSDVIIPLYETSYVCYVNKGIFSIFFKTSIQLGTGGNV